MTTKRLIENLLIALPTFLLLSMAINWLVYGIDLPNLDDWRGYMSGNIGHLDLAYLFTPANDTLYPVGKAFDALAQRYLNGNSVAYQFISMVFTLGSILLLIWQLLRKTTVTRIEAAIAFALCIFLLQPDSYWGRQNLAYHQAIPVITMLATLLLAVSDRPGRYLKVLIGFSLAIVGGWSYTSGALGGLALSGTLLVLCAVAPAIRRSSLPVGLGSFIGSAITTASQAWVILFYQAGQIHVANARWVMPYESEFWAYALGKFARSLILQDLPTSLGIALSAIAMLTVIAATLGLLVLAVTKRAADHLTVVFVPLAAAIGVYLMMVAASRAGMIGFDASFLEYYTYGFPRFHFFWLCILWPFVFVVMRRASLARAPDLASHAALAGGALAVLYAVNAGAASYGPNFKAVADTRLATEIPCLAKAMSETGPVNCSALYPKDVRSGVDYASANDSSWTRQYLSTISGEPVDLTKIVAINSQVALTGQRLELATQPDPQLFFDNAWPFDPATCRRLALSATINPLQDDRSQMFFAPVGEGLSEGKSTTVALLANKENTVRFEVESATGFSPVLRLDPVADSKAVSIANVSIGCLVRTAR